MALRPLEGKVALVTGGSRGIGAAIAVEFAKRGAAKVAITYAHNVEAAEKVVSEIQSHGAEGAHIQADVTSPTFGPDVISETLTRLATTRIDILVNNAALTSWSAQLRPLADLTPEFFTTTFLGNTYAAIAASLAVLPYLPPPAPAVVGTDEGGSAVGGSAGGGGGRIINISAASAEESGSEDPHSVYSASKAALNHLTRSFARRYSREYRCTVNAISVGATGTDDVVAMMRRAPPERRARVEGLALHGRVASPQEVARVVAWVADPESEWINGNCVPCNGGRVW